MGGKGSHEKAPSQGTEQDDPPASAQPVPLPATPSVPSISFQMADGSKQTNTMSEKSKIVMVSSGNKKFQEATNGSEQTNSMSGSSMVQITEPLTVLTEMIQGKKTDYNK